MENHGKNTLHEVCIIGAGLAGLAAARMLAENGIADVVVVDKGRSVGGRFATRRIGLGRADHGAQFMSARSDFFREWALARDVQEGLLTVWFTDKGDKFVAKDGMNEWLKMWSMRLPESYHLMTNIQVDRIEERHSEWWIGAGEDFALRAKALLITAPMPQALVLTEALQAAWSVADCERLRAVSFEPCLALIISLAEESAIPAPGYLRGDLPAPLAWVADNQQKGISAETILTVHLDAKWSSEHYEDSDAEIFASVWPALQTLLTERTTIQEWQLKRWRYALSSHLYPHAYYAAPHQAPLLFAGDGFSSDSLHPADEQGRAETACLSGVAAAKHLLQYFENTVRTSS